MAVVATSDGTPHLLIYKADCSSKWYDLHAATCF